MYYFSKKLVAYIPTYKKNIFFKKRQKHSKGYCAPVCHMACKAIGTLVQCTMMLLLITQSGVVNAGNSAERQVLYNINIPPQSIAQSLSDLSAQTDQMLLFSYAEVEPLKANPVVGKYTLQQALDIMLQGTGFSGSLTKQGVLMVSLSKSNATQKQAEGVESMTSKNKVLAAAIGFFVASGNTQPIVAQELGEESEIWELDEIIVTAQKREQNIQDVPISIAAIGSKELRDLGIVNLQDLAGAVPGLTVQQGSNITKPTIRGIGATGGFSAPLIGFYLDDISTSGNPAYALDLRAYDLERVEVLRGPQGTLYGDGSVGGTIRYITKKPELDFFSMSADLEAANTEDGAPSFESRGVVNVPLMRDKLGLRVAGTFDHDGGWIDLPVPDGPAGRENINSSDVVNVRTNLLWKASDNLEATGMVLLHRNDGNLTVGEDANGNALSPYGFTGDRFRNDDYELYGLTLVYDLGFAQLTSATSYVDARLEFLIASGIYTAPPPAEPTFAAFGPGEVDRNAFNQEVRLASNDQGKWAWQIGAHYRDREISQVTSSFLGPFDGELPSAPTSVTSGTEDTQSIALFGETSYQVLDWLEVGGGLRYFEDDRSFLRANLIQDAEFDALTGSAFVRASVTDNWNIYARYAEGFRSGGLNPLGIAPFEPEELQTYEIGFKGFFWGGRVNAELALYYNDFSDSQVTGLEPETRLFFTNNGGDVEIQGAEAALSLQVTGNFRLDMSGSYNDSEFVALNDVITLGELDIGDPLPLAPPYNFNISSTYDFEWRGMMGFIRADYNQAGRSVSYLIIETQSDVIQTLNANLHLDVTDNVSVGLFGTNLFNDRGFVDGQAFQNSSVRGRPRTVGIRLSFSH